MPIYWSQVSKCFYLYDRTVPTFILSNYAGFFPHVQHKNDQTQNGFSPSFVNSCDGRKWTLQRTADYKAVSHIQVSKKEFKHSTKNSHEQEEYFLCSYETWNGKRIKKGEQNQCQMKASHYILSMRLGCSIVNPQTEKTRTNFPFKMFYWSLKINLFIYVLVRCGAVRMSTRCILGRWLIEWIFRYNDDDTQVAVRMTANKYPEEYK